MFLQRSMIFLISPHSIFSMLGVYVCATAVDETKVDLSHFVLCLMKGRNFVLPAEEIHSNFHLYFLS